MTSDRGEHKGADNVGFSRSSEDLTDGPIATDKTTEPSSNHKAEGDASFLQLMLFPRVSDNFLLLLASLSAVVAGLGSPAYYIILGDMVDLFMNFTTASRTNSSALPAEAFQSAVFDSARWFLLAAAVLFFASAAQMALWEISALKRASQLRLRLFGAVLRQDVAWHDEQKAGELLTRLSDDIDVIQAASGAKMATFLQYASSFLAGLCLALWRSWRLALLSLPALPVLLVAVLLTGPPMRRLAHREHAAYGAASAIAEEVLTAIRTVVAFGGERKALRDYSSNLSLAERAGILKAALFGLALGIHGAVVFWIFGATFWLGTDSFLAKEVTAGTIVVILHCVYIGGLALGNGLQCMDSAWDARAAAQRVFRIIDREPQVTSGCEVPGRLLGRVEFRNVQFCYPSRPGEKVLDGLSFVLKPGRKLALVGDSGCGKSSVLRLLQRLYDVTGGEVVVPRVSR